MKKDSQNLRYKEGTCQTGFEIQNPFNEDSLIDELELDEDFVEVLTSKFKEK